MKENLHPSLLKGFSAKASTAVSWIMVINHITGGALLELTERYRMTGDPKWKAKLLSITPACQLNGQGKEAGDIVGLTGIVFVDIDGIPPEHIERIRTLVNADPHTFASKVSVSGRGLHILAKWFIPGGGKGLGLNEQYALAFLAVNCYYADLTGCSFDEKCCNVNRLMALNHDAKAYFNEEAIAFEVPADLVESTGSDHSATQQVMKHDTGLSKTAESPIDYAVRIVEKHGDSYYQSNRHNYLLKCLAMMNKLGVAQSEAEGWALAYDLGEKEIRTLVKSVYGLYAYQHGTYSLPERLHPMQPAGQPTSHSHNLTPSSHAHTREGFPEYKWPAFIQQMVDCGESKAQRDVILLSAIAVLGAMIGKVLRFKYSRRTWFPALQLFVIAPPASGKSVVSLVRCIADPLHDRLLAAYDAARTAYEKAKAVYDSSGKQRATMPIPQVPKRVMFLIAGNNSATGILENLADAKDRTALICESEADTLSGAINSDFGGWDDTLRKVFDHDLLSFNRRTNKEYQQIKAPCLGVVICGTPSQVRPLIPSVSNGLFSRQLFVSLPPIEEFVDQFGDDDVDLVAQFTQWGTEWLAVLEELKTHTSCIEMRLTASQRSEFNTLFAQLFLHAGCTQSDGYMKSAVAREAINVLRIMSVIAFFRAMETKQGMTPAKDIPEENIKDGICGRYDLAVTDADFHAVLALADPLYRNACDVLSLLPAAEMVHNAVSASNMLLSNLPLQFTRSEAVELGKQFGVTETNVDTILDRLKSSGKVVCRGRGEYSFLACVRERKA